ncbi:hypothetical protein GCM10009672_06370 [Nesterenkonia lutea]
MRIIIGLGIVGLGLLIYSLIECLQTPRHRIRVLPKIAWIAVIVLLPIIGAGLWLGFGRVRAPKKGSQAPRRPSSPDDDPDFLRQVEIQRRHRQREEEKLQREAEKRRQEHHQQELKARNAPAPRPQGENAQTQSREEQEKQLGEAADAAVSGESSSNGTGSFRQTGEEPPGRDDAPQEPETSEDDGEPGSPRSS